MARDQIIVGIDIGTTKVCTLIADVGGDVPEVLGVGICPSRGLTKGNVVDVQGAVESMDMALRRAEQQSGYKAISAFVGVAGSHVRSQSTRATVAIRDPSGLIGPEDVNRVLEGARVVQLPPDQEILHVLPHHFVVDGVDGIRDPVGMVGRRLEVEANVVTGSTTSVHSLVRCVDAININLDALVLEPLAAGRAVLSDDERTYGTLVLDLGGGTTDAAVFHGGSLAYSCILPVGGNQISSDLAYGLRASFASAEELKIRHGSTVSYARGEGEVAYVPFAAPGEPSEVEQCVVAEIIDARLAETFELVRDNVMRSGFGDCYAGGVVLTGGSSQIAGTPQLAAEIFGVPARLGGPARLRGLADAVRGPAFATSVGLLAWGQQQLASAAPASPGRVDRFGNAFKAWVRNFLP